MPGCGLGDDAAELIARSLNVNNRLQTLELPGAASTTALPSLSHKGLLLHMSPHNQVDSDTSVLQAMTSQAKALKLLQMCFKSATAP